jgi:hypothetical protein
MFYKLPPNSSRSVQPLLIWHVLQIGQKFSQPQSDDYLLFLWKKYAAKIKPSEQ